MNKENNKKGFNKFLDFVEKVGNKVPHPVIMFIYFCIGVIILSHILYVIGVSVTYQGIDMQTTQPVMSTVYVESLLTTEGIRHIFTSMVSNFQNMPAKAIVLVSMLGVGVAEGTGLISTVIRKTLLGASKRVVTFTVVFLGVLSSIASDAGYLVLIPLGAAIFHSMGRHPIAGLAAAFAGVSGGFGANIIITPVDGMLIAITNEAIALVNPEYTINMLSNFYFTFVSTFLITIVGGIVTEKVVEARLGKYTGNIPVENSKEITDDENRGLKFSFIALLAVVGIICLLTVPYGSALRNPETGEIFGVSPFMDSIVTIIMFVFLIPGIAYGYGCRVVKSSKDIINHATNAMSSMAGLLVIIFVVAQFINYFNYTNLGTVIAVQGAHTLESVGLTGIGLIISFIIFCAFSNLFIGGMITKWAVFAPVFIPMFMQMGISPEMTQAAYRVGDSITNIINPLMSFFAVIIVFAQKYDEDTGVGSVISIMIPYTLWFGISWIVLTVAWYVLGIPLGPGASIMIN